MPHAYYRTAPGRGQTREQTGPCSCLVNVTMEPMTLSRNAKIFLMFAPLALGMLVLAVLVQDARHPQTDTDACMVIAVGAEASALRTPDNTLYAHDSEPVHDVAFHCTHRAVAVINDMDIFYSPVHEGNGAVVTHRVYRYLPERWHVDIHTPDSDNHTMPDTRQQH